MSLNIFTIPTSSFDVSLLPESARDSKSQEFSNALQQYFINKYHGLGQNALIDYDEEKITVVTFAKSVANPFEMVLAMLQQGRIKEAYPYLLAFTRANPADPEYLYNLGIAQSELGQFDEAVMTLQRCVRIDPENVNALTGLGVAYHHLSQDVQAETYLREALRFEPTNVYAARNLGAILGLNDRSSEALQFFETAYRSNPKEPSAIYGLAKALDALDDDAALQRADELYVILIEQHARTKFADFAKEARTAITQKILRRKVGGSIRMDVVMYIAGILDVFKAEGAKRRQEITFEVAMVGTRGLDINDVAQKYTLKSMPGKEFSGLHLLSIMYAGFRQIDPKADVGADFSAEYKLAEAF